MSRFRSQVNIVQSTQRFLDSYDHYEPPYGERLREDRPRTRGMQMPRRDQQTPANESGRPVYTSYQGSNHSAYHQGPQHPVSGSYQNHSPPAPPTRCRQCGTTLLRINQSNGSAVQGSSSSQWPYSSQYPYPARFFCPHCDGGSSVPATPSHSFPQQGSYVCAQHSSEQVYGQSSHGYGGSNYQGSSHPLGASGSGSANSSQPYTQCSHDRVQDGV